MDLTDNTFSVGTHVEASEEAAAEAAPEAAAEAAAAAAPVPPKNNTPRTTSPTPSGRAGSGGAWGRCLFRSVPSGIHPTLA